ncbi:methylated-DNA--[protein]-cysteine S-methyltransferase [Epibacterium ulvae]|uniref:methylated-DNA--[protein]-cysteine S-methyltransferase n=1 Tax=Epibacterium ulvae TaxID=1156985 RepID=UPI001BFC3EB2|nr:methylated-DNA--[protein]-cysteine S-methyltransferase [Epibacterium ulvae]MBT8153042.1 methylated-DNA--[protein]-cysteine S-methyltransferase [Epibacterium ulvae]
MRTSSLLTPVGRMFVSENAGYLVRLTWEGVETETTDLLSEALRQLEAYFAGRLQEFDLPMQLAGSAFQQKVCAAMQAIPFGETRQYGDIARDLGGAAQPVGNACGANPLPVLIPCHRVLAANGLGGFSGAGGVETKVALLRHEGAAGLLI